MRQPKKLCREEILRQMMSLATKPVNDAVRLAYLPLEREEEIAGLDLTGLTEFKRNNNGTVEIKLTDRIAALEKLLDRVDSGQQDRAAAFFQALEGTEDPGERDISRR